MGQRGSRGEGAAFYLSPVSPAADAAGGAAGDRLFSKAQRFSASRLSSQEPDQEWKFLRDDDSLTFYALQGS